MKTNLANTKLELLIDTSEIQRKGGPDTFEIM